MAKSLQISCPNCGTNQNVPIEKVPEGGAWGRCAVCRERIFIRKDNLPAPVETASSTGTPREQVTTFAPPGRGADPDIILKTPGGFPVRLKTAELEERIRSQQVLPWDLISSDGSSFSPAQKHPDLAGLFQGYPTVVPRHCWNHKEESPEKICARCQRCYCRDCVPPPEKHEPPIYLCRACGGILQETDPGWREMPYWKRLDEVMRFPIAESAWQWTVGLGLILWVAGLSRWTLVLLLPAFLFSIYAVLQSAKGHRKLAVDWKNADKRELGERSLLALLVTLAIAAPFIAVNALASFGLASFLNFFLGLAAFGVYPMALATATLSARPLRAFHVQSVIRQIHRAGERYLSLLLGLLVLSVGAFIVQIGLSFIPLLGRPLAGVVQAYSTVVGAHIIGWTFYLSLGRLGWRRGPVV